MPPSSIGFLKRPTKIAFKSVVHCLAMSLAVLFLPDIAGGDRASAQQRFIRLQPNVVVDHTGFGGPIAAATLLTPMGWRASGGVAWGRQHSCTNGFAIEWRAVSRDGLRGIVVLPHQGWEYSSNNSRTKANIACPILRITNISQYLRVILRKLRPDARVLGIRRRPDILRELPRFRYNRRWAMGREVGWMEAAEIVFTMVERGVRLEGRIAAAVKFEKTMTRTSALNADLVIGRAYTAYGSFAPAGQYDQTLFEFVRKTLQVDARWGRLIAQHNKIMGDINREGFRRRNQILTQANRDIINIILQGWRRRQQINDRGHRKLIRAIREVEVFRDSTQPGGRVELSNQYRHAWRLRDGTYVLTDSAGFNPNRDLGIGGTRLTRAR